MQELKKNPNILIKRPQLLPLKQDFMGKFVQIDY